MTPLSIFQSTTFVGLAIIAGIFGGINEAFAGSCHINVVSSCSQPGVQPDTWFVDSYSPSHSDQLTCMQRAKDYQYYCNSPFAYSYFSAGTGQSKDDSWQLVKAGGGQPVGFQLAAGHSLPFIGLSYGSRLTLQTDGNFVLYHDGQPIWNSETYGLNCAGNCMANLQGDGNLVLYKDLPSASAYWASGTGGHQGGLTLKLATSEPHIALTDNLGKVAWAQIQLSNRGEWQPLQGSGVYEGTYGVPFEAEITSVKFRIDNLPIDKPKDICLLMSPYMNSVGSGYLGFGMGGSEEQFCLWTQHRASNNSSRNTTINFSSMPIYVPQQSHLLCNMTENSTGDLTNYTCTVTLRTQVAGTPRYRFIRLPFIDEILSPSRPFLPSYYWRWTPSKPLEITGFIPYTSLESQGNNSATLNTCLNVVHQGGAIVSSDCVPTQVTGPGINFHSPGLIPVNRTISGTDLLTSTCSSTAPSYDCAAFTIAKIPAEFPRTWHNAFYDYGQVASLGYCTEFANSVPAFSSAAPLCAIQNDQQPCTPAKVEHVCKLLFQKPPCYYDGSCN